jgi:hypothetical protein
MKFHALSFQRGFVKLGVVAAAAVVLAGCAASGAKYQDMAESIPSLNRGQGRIYFLRSASLFGAAVRPEIRLNGEVVGSSMPGGFFFVDRPAGKYSAAAETETEKTLSFALDAGETKYLRTSPAMGLLVGRIVIDLETQEKAKEELPSLSYTGAALGDKAAGTGVSEQTDPPRTDPVKRAPHSKDRAAGKKEKP